MSVRDTRGTEGGEGPLNETWNQAGKRWDLSKHVLLIENILDNKCVSVVAALQGETEQSKNINSKINGPVIKL